MTLRSLSGLATAALGASLLILSTASCDEEGKTAPEICATPALEIFDIQGGAEGTTNPCVTKIGHAISPTPTFGGSAVAGSATGGTTTGGAPASSDAGAGGA